MIDLVTVKERGLFQPRGDKPMSTSPNRMIESLIKFIANLKPGLASFFSRRLATIQRILVSCYRTLLQRRGSIWFSDGTIILEAEETLFRVYSGILAENSSVFGDMLLVAQPAAHAEEVIDGCPVVHMPGDSSTDMCYFLKTMHDAGYYDSSTMTKFDVIAGVLRLSTKYDVGYLRTRAYRQLAVIFPTTLKQWDRRQTDSTVEYFTARPLAVVNLARLTNLPALLPAALCSCCWMGAELSPPINSIHTIMNGLNSVDGTHLELSSDDKRTCLQARENLIVAQRTRLLGFLSAEASYPSCRSPDRCSSAKVQALGRWERKYKGGREIHPFLVTFEWDTFQNGVCPLCYSSSKNSFKNAREQLWNDLPTFFGLAGWHELGRSSA